MFTANGLQTSWLNVALLIEWIAYFSISFIEFIAWILAVVGDPLFYVIWAYVSLWGSTIMYGLPIIFIIIHAVNSNTLVKVNWTTDGAMTHLIIDIFLWIVTSLFHYFFYPELVIQYS